jgi:hypothetical protein
MRKDGDKEGGKEDLFSVGRLGMPVLCLVRRLGTASLRLELRCRLLESWSSNRICIKIVFVL